MGDPTPVLGYAHDTRPRRRWLAKTLVMLLCAGIGAIAARGFDTTQYSSVATITVPVTADAPTPTLPPPDINAIAELLKSNGKPVPAGEIRRGLQVLPMERDIAWIMYVSGDPVTSSAVARAAADVYVAKDPSLTVLSAPGISARAKTPLLLSVIGAGIGAAIGLAGVAIVEHFRRRRAS